MRNLDGPAGAIDWNSAVDQALFSPDGIRLAFQPIVDLQRATVAGYEVLARFDVPGLPSSPLPWLTAAREQGRLAALEQTVLVRALEARHHLQANVFLSVNLSAGVLVDPTTAALFAGAGDLRGVVIEITEHDRVLDYDVLRDAFAPTREAGAMLGVDDAGAGYASLGHVLALRPEFVKLDRDLVADLDREHGRCAAVAAIGALAGELDGWLVAEGIERAGELDALVGLDVPLGQGYFLGRPEYERADVPQEVVAQLRTATRKGRVQQPVRSLVQDVAMRPADAGWATLLEEAAAASALAGDAHPQAGDADLDAAWRGTGSGLQDTTWTGPGAALERSAAAWPGGDLGTGRDHAGWPGGSSGLDVQFDGWPSTTESSGGWPGATASPDGSLDGWPGTPDGGGSLAGWPGTADGGGSHDGWPSETPGSGGSHDGWPGASTGLGDLDAGWPGTSTGTDSRTGTGPGLGAAGNGLADGLADHQQLDSGWPTAVPALTADRPGQLPGAPAAPPVVVLVDPHGAPVALELDGRPASWGPRPMTVLAGEAVADVALRCTNRPAAERLLPVVCCDGRGRALGVVTVDALLHALARERVEAARG